MYSCNRARKLQYTRILDNLQTPCFLVHSLLVGDDLSSQSFTNRSLYWYWYLMLLELRRCRRSGLVCCFSALALGLGAGRGYNDGSIHTAEREDCREVQVLLLLRGSSFTLSTGYLRHVVWHLIFTCIPTAPALCPLPSSSLHSTPLT